MVDKIRNEAQYNQVMALIEKFISKATGGGGFNSLSAAEAEELSHLSLLVEHYEDNVLKIMPLPENV
jgi:HTH-type transcriptional regulator/antitoxin HigA